MFDIFLRNGNISILAPSHIALEAQIQTDSILLSGSILTTRFYSSVSTFLSYWKKHWFSLTSTWKSGEDLIEIPIKLRMLGLGN